MSTAKGNARREAILNAAEQVLIRAGHSALSVRSVAEAAAVRLGHLQYYFPTREALVTELLARVLSRSLDRLSSLIPDRAGKNPSAQVDMLVEHLLAEQCETELVTVFAELWALAARDETVGSAVSGFYRRYVDLVADQLCRLLPGLPTEQARARATTFVALIEGSTLVRSAVTGSATATADELIRRTASNILLTGAPTAGEQ